jgi:hypothetical protein
MLFYPFCLTVVAFSLQMAGSRLNLVTAVNGGCNRQRQPSPQDIQISILRLGGMHEICYNQDYGIFPVDSLGARRDKTLSYFLLLPSRQEYAKCS